MSPTATQLILWGAGTPRTLRPIWAACELGLEFDHRPIGSRTGETQSQKFTTLNHGQKIPVLEDGDFVLRESSAIVNYFSDKSDEGSLIPRNARDRATYDSWLTFVLMELDAHTLYVMRKHRDLADLYGEAPAAVATAQAGFERQAQVPAEAIEREGPFLLGATFTGADIILGSCLDWAHAYTVPVPESLAKYHARLREREAYIQAFDINYRTRPEISPFKD